MFLLVIAGLVISVSAPRAAAWEMSTLLSALATWGLAAAGLPMGLLCVLAVRRRKPGPSLQDTAVYVHRIHFLYNLCLIALFCASQYVFGWRRVVWAVCEGVDRTGKKKEVNAQELFH
ncbi:hypothetical protein ACFL01_01635 [Planctomycetota bacterium]